MDFRKSKISFEGKDFTLIEIEEIEVGLTNLHLLKYKIEQEISEGNPNIGIDLKNINVINSSGLGVLIGCLNRIKEQNGSLILFNPSEKIMNIFKITKLNLVFEIRKI